MRLPLVTDVRGFSLDDGPGIRSTVFLKGCPLSCVWCHNPESWKTESEIAFYSNRCIGCGDCVAVCPEGAVSPDIPGRIDRSRCTACGTCAEACPSAALQVLGKHYEPDALADLLLRNRLFFETSGGGVTFSGGEPTLHMDYLSPVMEGLKQRGIHITLQTSGLFDIEEFKKKIFPFVDLIHYDVKFADEEMHRKYTGVGNGKIRENLIALQKEGRCTIIPRTPLVPGITARETNITAIATFLNDAGCDRYELLPYNPGGIAKRRAIGKTGDTELSRAMMSGEEEIKWIKYGKDSLVKARSLFEQRAVVPTG